MSEISQVADLIMFEIKTSAFQYSFAYTLKQSNFLKPNIQSSLPFIFYLQFKIKI